MNCVEDITRWQVDDKAKSSQKLGYVWALPFHHLLSKLCVCLSSNLFEPQLENSQEAQFSPILWPLQRQSQFSALDMELNTGAVHYGCWFSTGPQPSGGHICHKVNNNKKWTWIDHQNAVGTMQWITNSTTNNNDMHMGCSSAIVMNLFCR
jgi:hypothetical protein